MEYLQQRRGGSVFVSASATGFLPGETRQAAFLAAGASLPGIDVTLSGRPPDTATYVGSTACLTCHSFLDPDLVAAWQASAHVGAVDRTTAHVDVAGWPAAPGDCAAPATRDAGFMATDPDPTRGRSTLDLTQAGRLPTSSATSVLTPSGLPGPR